MNDAAFLGPRVSAYPWALSHAYETSGARRTTTATGFNGGMLREDISNLQYGYRVHLRTEGLGFEDASNALNALLNDFNHHDYDRDPADLVFSFVARLLDDSASSPGLVLETFSLDSDHNKSVRSQRRRHEADGQEVGQWRPSLGYIPRWSVISHKGGITQVAKTSEAAEVLIPRSSLKIATLRRPTLETWQKVIRDLCEVDNLRPFGDPLARMSWKGYSFTEQVEAQNLAILASTAPIGWDGRSLFNQLVTPHHMAYRQLKFAAFWVDVVEQALEFLNGVTSNPRIYGSGTFTFALEGLPSRTDLLRGMDDLRSGTLTIETANDQLLHPRFARQDNETSAT